MAAYKHYDVLLVNAMFDGMNLVAKEGPIVNEREGVSILSENTGAHEELGEFALSVNPFDIQELANSIYAALTMDRGRARAARGRARRDRHLARPGRLDRRAARGHPRQGPDALARLGEPLGFAVAPQRARMTLPAPTYDLVLAPRPARPTTPRARRSSPTRARAIAAQGELLRHDEWGERPLAYPIERRASARVPPDAVPRRHARAAQRPRPHAAHRRRDPALSHHQAGARASRTRPDMRAARRGPPAARRVRPTASRRRAPAAEAAPPATPRPRPRRRAGRAPPTRRAAGPAAAEPAAEAAAASRRSSSPRRPAHRRSGRSARRTPASAPSQRPAG